MMNNNSTIDRMIRHRLPRRNRETVKDDTGACHAPLPCVDITPIRSGVESMSCRGACHAPVVQTNLIRAVEPAGGRQRAHAMRPYEMSSPIQNELGAITFVVGARGARPFPLTQPIASNKPPS